MDFGMESQTKLIWKGPDAGLQYYEAVNKSTVWKFKKKPLSVEEAEYPIAYGMLVYTGIQQVMYELGSFYQPQNAYCIAVDGRSTRTFMRRIKMLEECFPNIHVFQTTPIEYCKYEILATLWKCVEKLSFSKHPWKYFQYISGVDLPLKTNREMVRIFKALNGSFNIDLMKVELYRIPKMKPLLEMWKSSMSALFSRESANFMVRNPIIKHYLKNLRHGYCQDESLWGTVAGQPNIIPMPGGFNGTELFQRIFDQVPKMERLAKVKRKPTANEPFPLKSFYISRYQVWDRIDFVNAGTICKGTFINFSCVFGPNSLEDLIIRPELVVHKLYFDSYPATFFCLYEKIWERTLEVEKQALFDASAYSNLALVRYQEKGSLDGLKLYF
ncbi:hypothetical protein FO519_005365 [Halicephalobus sp. NKZ332]|nr:hypothetical protein FO519_005365 [Halicephalobus sp. NKZ332]